jgi:hypothetical protein
MGINETNNKNQEIRNKGEDENYLKKQILYQKEDQDQ